MNRPDDRPVQWPVQWPGRLMCACADNDANWRGHGLTARYVCTCGETTTSAKGLRWAPIDEADEPEQDR